MGVSERSLSNLRQPWNRGECGNKDGRPRKYHEVLRLARANSIDAIRLLAKCMRDEKAPWPARIRAIELILDRAWGAPDQRLQLDGDGITSLAIKFVGPSGDPVDNPGRRTINGTVESVEATEAETFSTSLDGGQGHRELAPETSPREAQNGRLLAAEPPTNGHALTIVACENNKRAEEPSALPPGSEPRAVVRLRSKAPARARHWMG
jgi:hypothetical protein